MTSGSDASRAPATAGLLQLMADAAVAGGAAILDVRARGVTGRLKADHSPVTEADEAAERVILARLAGACPAIPAVSEEATSAGRGPQPTDLFFLVDPLDGTREFLAGRDEFTVNVALVSDRRPVAGAIYAPASGQLWVGATLPGVSGVRIADVAPGAGAPALAEMRLLSTGGARPVAPVALLSRSHGDPRAEAILARVHVAERRLLGSSIKFCLLAEGAAAVYPRFGRTMEWDTAAGDAILRAAGGGAFDLAGRPLVYGKSGYENGDFVAWARLPLD